MRSGCSARFSCGRQTVRYCRYRAREPLGTGELALAHHQGSPSQTFQRSSGRPVARDVFREFALPNGYARLGRIRELAPLMPVPKAHVHEYDGSVLCRAEDRTVG